MDNVHSETIKRKTSRRPFRAGRLRPLPFLAAGEGCDPLLTAHSGESAAEPQAPEQIECPQNCGRIAPLLVQSAASCYNGWAKSAMSCRQVRRCSQVDALGPNQGRSHNGAVRVPGKSGAAYRPCG